MIRAMWLAGALITVAQGAAAVECASVIFQEARYSICEVDATVEDLELFLYDDAGDPLGQFATVDGALAEQNKRLIFAMNAGMYHENRAPVGHYVEDGKEIMRVIDTAGPGNFGLLPNGVFCLREGRADVFETTRYIKDDPRCEDATQSGPMLVIDGALHPRFLADGTSKYIRNGVGTSADGTRAYFAISDEPVNFHSFGLLFRDHIKVPNALYFDGNISRLYAPSLKRSDFGFSLGPIVGVVAPIE
ncbi:phosphodiester glycosidase family protein [Roseobacter sp. YSTF-M11]|uniref:Phosphodiester glycosidase family protein n=1 Tax=Roseobacter insulae TaxID=2859783 RepID=A0A9X1JX15_9RHOB|nr:phosphodiester glycosidase family protein [Roseobacter insulae]MBW4706516.1 phosphodiester glycosidase family protein [Roseobacter insulae]